jgi:hypothetical protein
MWLGHDQGDYVVRLPIDVRLVSTTTFDIAEPELGQVLEAARGATREKLPQILAHVASPGHEARAAQAGSLM